MNVKLALILILLFLILLVLFYNINLESNIVILLGIIIILLINDLIKRSEYFEDSSSITDIKFIKPGNSIPELQNSQLAQLSALNTIVQRLNINKQNNITEKNMNTNYPSIIVNNSCIKQINTKPDSPNMESVSNNEVEDSRGLDPLIKSKLLDKVNRN